MSRPKPTEAYLTLAVPLGTILVWIPAGIAVAIVALAWAIYRWGVS